MSNRITLFSLTLTQYIAVMFRYEAWVRYIYIVLFNSFGVQKIMSINIIR